MSFLSRIKKLSRKVILVCVLAFTLACYTALSASAAVNLSGGLENIISPLKTQIKNVAALIFALLAIVAIAFAIIKLVTALLENHRNNEPVNWKPICFAFAAAVVCGLCSSTLFFTWFGI